MGPEHVSWLSVSRSVLEDAKLSRRGLKELGGPSTRSAGVCC